MILYAKICIEYLPILTKRKVDLNSSIIGNELFEPVSVT